MLCVSGLLLFLALASYSPLDPSFNSASVLTGSQSARNWVGLVGAVVADLVLQAFGIGAFLLPVFLTAMGSRWFRSRKITSPIAKSLGAAWLMIFVPALLALMPGHVRWMSVIPMEGLAGRIVGDVLIHYLNLAGAYIVCATVLAVALYLTTAFSFASLRLWAPTRFAFVVALWNRYKDWQDEPREKENAEGVGKAARNPANHYSSTGSARRPASAPVQAPEPVRATGIDRMTSASRGEEIEPVRQLATFRKRLFRRLKSPSGPTLEPSRRQRCRELPPGDSSCRPAACCIGRKDSRQSTPMN